MATRDVELIIKARDQASQVASSISAAFTQLAASEQKVGQQSGDASSLIGQLGEELRRLQTVGQGLGAFATIANQVDRATVAIQRQQSAVERSRQGFVQQAEIAQRAAIAQASLQDRVERATKAVEAQKAALTAAQEAQARIQGGVNAGRTAGVSDTNLAPDLAALSRAKNVTAEASVAFKTAQIDLRNLNRELVASNQAASVANVAFDKSAVTLRSQQAALEASEQEFGQLTTTANQAGAALGGVAANQKAVTDAARANAAALQQVGEALARQAGAGPTGAQAGSVAQFKAQQQTLAQLRAEQQKAQDSVRALAQQMRAAGQPTEELQRDFLLAKAAANAAAKDVDTFAASIRKANPAGGGFAAFNQAATAIQAEGVAAQQAAAKNATLSGQIEKLVRNMLGLRPAAEAAAAAQAKLAANANRSFLARAFGVEDNRVPSRLQNLSFQVNDIVSGLASGQRPAQIFAQQVGQIGQLFPAFNNLLLTFLRLLPALAVFGALLSPVIGAIGEATGRSEAIRTFNQQLAGTEAAAHTSSAALANAAREIDHYGGSLDSAIKQEQELFNQGVAVDHLADVAKASQNVARVLGVDVQTATQQVGQALTGTAADALKLDDSLHFLTASERDHIQALDEIHDAATQGERDAERRRIVDEALFRRNEAIAANSRGPWAQAFRDLGAAFNELATSLANSDVFKAVGAGLDGLAHDVDNLVNRFRVGAERIRGAVTGQGFDLEGARQRVAAADANANGRSNGGVLSPEAQARADQARADAQRQFNNQLAIEQASRERIATATRDGKVAAAEQRAEEELLNRARASGATATAQQIAQARQIAGDQERAQQAASAAGRESQSQLNRQRAFNAELEKQIGQRTLEARLVGETARNQAIDRAETEAVLRAEQQRVTLSQTQRDAVRQSAGELFDAQQAQQQRNTLLQNEIQIRTLLHQTVSAQQTVEEQALLQNIDLTTAQGQAWAESQRRVVELTRSTEELARQQEIVGGLAQQLRTGEAEFRQAQQQGETQDQLEARRAALDALSAQLTTARDHAIELATALNDQGALEHLRAIRTEVGNVTAELLTAAQANTQFAQGLSGAIDKSSESIANAIDGTEKWSDAIHDIGDAFRQFAADFLRNIAQMIIQALILKAIQSTGFGGAVSGFVGALTKHGGGMVGTAGISKLVNPMVFAGAARFHGGGFPGLAPSEVPIIAKKGEEVLSETDPRNAANGGKGGQNGGVRIVNVFDAADVLQSALGRTAGEQVLMNFVRENAQGINAALGRSK